MKFVEDISDGLIELECAEPGAIVPTVDVLDAVGKGILDFAPNAYPGFWSRAYPEFDVAIGLPFAWMNPEEHWDAMKYWGLYEELQEVFHELNVHWLPMNCNDIYHFGTTFPVDTPDAIKGKKIRALGIYGDYVKALGGAPVVLPAGELYMALKLGTLDGTIYGISGLSDLKLNEVWTHYVTDPNPNVIGTAAIINLDRWNELPERVRYMYDTWGYHVMYAAWTDYQQFEAYLIADAEKNWGFKQVTWSPEDKARVFEIGIGLWDTVAAKSPRSERLVEIVKSQARHLGRIK